MKVYIVSELDYDWTKTLKVYLSMERAVAYVEDLFEKFCEHAPYNRYKGWNSYWEIEEVEVDDV